MNVTYTLIQLLDLIAVKCCVRSKNYETPRYSIVSSLLLPLLC
jgi:hypothetical protein